MKSFSLLGVRLDIIQPTDLPQILRQKLQSGKCCHITTINPEFLVEAHHNPEFKIILNHADLNLCDGIGITLISRLLYSQSIPRIPGVHVAELLCQAAADTGTSVFFLGGFGVAERAAQTMQAKYPALQVAGTLDGDPNTLEEVQRTNPGIILVAFGAPAQEQWIAKNAPKIPSLRLAGGFGGTFDYWAGKIPHAPKAMRTLGLEWLFRLITNPKKRAPRIWNAVIVFPILALRSRLKIL